jgi:lipoprotein-anchoring transpeptidase ErfK/SrfK
MISPVETNSTVGTHKLPHDFFFRVKNLGERFTPDVLWVRINQQRMYRFTATTARSREQQFPEYKLVKKFVSSTSRYGIGEVAGSNMTPRGLHRIAKKIGGGWPAGAVFKERIFQGYTWAGMPDAFITHRIMWLEGLEPGFNKGGNRDSYNRYIYIHGTGNEPKIGRPASHGCMHLSATDLVPLYDQIPEHSLVWVSVL